MPSSRDPGPDTHGPAGSPQQWDSVQGQAPDTHLSLLFSPHGHKIPFRRTSNLGLHRKPKGFLGPQTFSVLGKLGCLVTLFINFLSSQHF